MNVALWRHEVRRAGWPAIVTPAVVVVAMLGMAAVMVAGSAPSDTVGRLLVAGLEVGLPLAAGIGAAALVGRDPAIELQLSAPTPYRVTVLRRLAITVAGPVLLAAAGTTVLRATGWWPAVHLGASSVLVWLGPVAWLSALGAFLAVGLRSAAAASGLIAGVWLAEQLFAGLFAAHAAGRALYLFPTTWLPGMPGWPVNRAVLLATAAVLLAGACLLLSRPHRLLTEEDA